MVNENSNYNSPSNDIDRIRVIAGEYDHVKPEMKIAAGLTGNTEKITAALNAENIAFTLKKDVFSIETNPEVIAANNLTNWAKNNLTEDVTLKYGNLHIGNETIPVEGLGSVNHPVKNRLDPHEKLTITPNDIQRTLLNAITKNFYLLGDDVAEQTTNAVRDLLDNKNIALLKQANQQLDTGENIAAPLTALAKHGVISQAKATEIQQAEIERKTINAQAVVETRLMIPNEGQDATKYQENADNLKPEDLVSWDVKLPSTQTSIQFDNTITATGSSPSASIIVANKLVDTYRESLKPLAQPTDDARYKEEPAFEAGKTIIRLEDIDAKAVLAALSENNLIPKTLIDIASDRFIKFVEAKAKPKLKTLRAPSTNVSGARGMGRSKEQSASIGI